MADKQNLLDRLDWLLKRLNDAGIDGKLDAIAVSDAIKELKERKTGYWIVLTYCANEGIYCSECNHKIFSQSTPPKKKLSNYCPNCGSRNDRFFNPSTKEVESNGE